MGFFAGFASAFRGAWTLATTPSLWTYALAPVVAAVALMMAAAAALKAWAFEPIKRWTTDAIGSAEWADWLVSLFAATVAVVAVFFLFSTLVRVVAAPFLALLADRTIVRLSGRPTPAAPGGPVVRWVVRPFVEAVKLLAIKLVVTVAALPLLLVPVVGLFLFWFAAAIVFGLDLIDIALAARGLLLRDRLRFARSHAGAFIGLGLGGTLMLSVPCLNLVLLPASVVGAVLLDQRLSPDFPQAATA